jgi:hypothetical protein
MLMRHKLLFFFTTLFSLFFYIKPKSIASKKPWTFIVYCAADNDLYTFAGRNIKQMEAVGSNDYLTILVQLDMHLQGQKKTTKRYLIKKNKTVLLETIESGLDSGDPESVIDCCRWAAKKFPAENYALDFWNHGTGIIDPEVKRIINPSDLFIYNQTNSMIELQRSIGFFDYIENNYFTENNEQLAKRGICFDSTTRNYLTNEKIDYALNTICTHIIKKKFGIIAFDACLMSMLEIMNIIKNYSHYAVASQEAELGAGWGYTDVLLPVSIESLSPSDFAKNIVYAYEKTYKKITKDYTQSAIDLSKIERVERTIDNLSKRLIEGISLQTDDSVRQMIKISRNRYNCTYFSEPDYIDLCHLLINIRKKIDLIQLKQKDKELNYKNTLKKEVDEALLSLEEAVIANVTGKNLLDAKGLSIYFPEKKLRNCYKKTNFCATNSWFSLIKILL